MISKLCLLSKSDDSVVYGYSCSKSLELIDGEIQYDFKDDVFTTIKTATNDNGGIAKWLYNHLYKVIFDEHCPEKRMIATG